MRRSRRDLHDDLVVAHAIANQIVVLWNGGGAGFAEQITYSLHSGSAAAARVVVADLDGDGALDIAATDVKDTPGATGSLFGSTKAVTHLIPRFAAGSAPDQASMARHPPTPCWPSWIRTIRGVKTWSSD